MVANKQGWTYKQRCRLNRMLPQIEAAFQAFPVLLQRIRSTHKSSVSFDIHF